MHGKVVLITGAARRIGAAIATELHHQGAAVAIHYFQSQRDATALASQLNDRRSDSAMAVQADLRRVAELPQLVDAVIKRFGRLDALVNNASTFYPTKVGSITTEHWDDLLGTNLAAPLFLSQAAAPHIREADGAIVNLIDIHGQKPLAEHPVYCAAKAGLQMLTRSLARELGPEIRVNGVAPGPIMWPEKTPDAATREKIIAATALQRTGEPADIAKTVSFLINNAPFITGQIIAVDGGRSI